MERKMWEHKEQFETMMMEKEDRLTLKYEQHVHFQRFKEKDYTLPE